MKVHLVKPKSHPDDGRCRVVGCRSPYECYWRGLPVCNAHYTYFKHLAQLKHIRIKIKQGAELC